MEACARLVVAGVDPHDAYENRDAGDVDFWLLVARRAAELDLEMWKQRARVLIGEYGIALRNGQRRNSRNTAGRGR